MIKEITCPNCNKKLNVYASRAIRYCPCCAKELPAEEKPVLNTSGQENTLITGEREPIAVFSPKQRENMTKPKSSIGAQIRRSIIFILLIYFIILVYILDMTTENGAYLLLASVFGIYLAIRGLKTLARWISKIIIRFHDREIDQNSSSE